MYPDNMIPINIVEVERWMIFKIVASYPIFFQKSGDIYTSRCLRYLMLAWKLFLQILFVWRNPGVPLKNPRKRKIGQKTNERKEKGK